MAKLDIFWVPRVSGVFRERPIKAWDANGDKMVRYSPHIIPGGCMYTIPDTQKNRFHFEDQFGEDYKLERPTVTEDVKDMNSVQKKPPVVETPATSLSTDDTVMGEAVKTEKIQKNDEPEKVDRFSVMAKLKKLQIPFKVTESTKRLLEKLP